MTGERKADTSHVIRNTASAIHNSFLYVLWSKMTCTFVCVFLSLTGCELISVGNLQIGSNIVAIWFSRQFAVKYQKNASIYSTASIKAWSDRSKWNLKGNTVLLSWAKGITMISFNLIAIALIYWANNENTWGTGYESIN